ncbi:GNAT family N-acetyltransferase [Lysobacter sp. S4-A87]|uniref:GNAT family N-acetyltransferase n=1 Tax=Lysobacter sp. S4-A87 TaxID=2925843 RepID=UPI001F537022|nr:GNAT family N-acetyltransferase [Lysobacter sp. S4-A87]UNK50218.1 GNAT family N-acetyltransferase [Lysobacter sp. S4-A87]
MTPAEPVVLRQATVADATAISALVCDLTQRWIAADCTPDGAARLLQMLAPGPTATRLGEGYRYVVAQRGQSLVGVAALRLPAHLFHLFVADDAQRQGLARRMWRTVQAWVDGPSPITVNASRHALAVYRKFGFEAIAGEVSEHGIVFTPMEWRPDGEV